MPPPSAPSLTTFQYATSLQPTGNVYVMDGQSSLTAASVTAFPTTALTVAFWVKTTATANQTLFRYGSGAGQLAIANPAGVVVTLGTASTGVTGVAVNDGAWHHLAVTLDVRAPGTAVVRIFVDGALVFQSSALAAGGGLQAGQTLVLGQAAATGEGYVGSMAEFVVWSSVLSANAVASAMAVRQSAGQGVALYWSLASAQSVTGSGGTVQGGSFSPDAALVFRQVQTTAAWSAVTGATYQLRVVDDGGCVAFDQSGITATTTPVTGVLLNAVYTARVRAQVASEWSAWSAPLSLTPLLLQPVLLDYDNATLSATWPAVDQEAQYAVSLFQDGSQTPATTTQTARTLALSTQLAGQSTYGVVVRALTAGSLGPGNPSTPVAAPVFTFALDESDPATPLLQVAWQPTAGAVRYYLTLTKQGTATPALAVLLNPSQTPYSISSATVPFQNGDTWTAALRALGPGYIGAWAPGQTITLATLAAPTLSFAWNTTGVDVTWPDVRTAAQQTAGLAVTYDLQLLQDGAVVDSQQNLPNTTAGRTYALSTSTANRLAQDHTFAVKVRARAPGVTGPWNTPPTLAAPTGTTLAYDWAQANPVQVGWTAAAGAEGYFYEVIRQGTVIGSAHVTGTSDSSNPPVNDGDTVSLQVRAFAAGALGSYSTAVTLTVQQFAGPLISPLTANAATHQVVASWTFQDPDAPSPTYTAELWQGSTRLGQPWSGQATSATFTDNAVVDGATLTVKVRAAQGSNAGKWAQSTVTVTSAGTLGQVTGLTVGSNAGGDLSCSWQAVSGTGVTYTVQVLSGSSVQYTSGAVSGTSTTLLQTDTHVTVGSTYQVQVRAVQGTAQGAWSAAVSVQAGTPNPHTDPVSPVGGDPVNLATGAYTFHSTDLQTLGVFPLVFETSYATSTPLPSESTLYPGPPLGPRWNHTYNTRIAVSEGVAYVIWGTGGVGGYTVPASVTGAYTRLGAPDGSTLFLATTWVYTLTAADGSVYTFDRAGVLQSIASPAGNLQTLTYTAGQLTRVTDAASGRYLNLAYHPGGVLKSVTDNAGRSAQYGYTGGNLTSITDPLGKQQLFTYAANTLSLIETVTDQDGVTYLKNVYDGQNRVTFQQDGRALAASASYGMTIGYVAATVDGLPGTLVTCTDAEGNVCEYAVVQANAATHRYVAYLNAAKTQIRRITYAYDGFGRVTAETLYEGPASSADTRGGNTTLYAYDANGNLQSTTTPNGLVTSTQWNAANLPVSRTDWLGNVTGWTYEGNLVKTETDALGRVATWSYRSGSIRGLVSTLQDVNGNTTTYDYYASGDEKTATAPTGQVLYLVSDAVGRTTRIENRDSAGAALRTTTLEYDAASRPLKAKVWMTGMTEAQAFVYTYGYDGVGRQTSVTNPLNNTTSYEFDPNGLLKKVVYPTPAGTTQTTVYDYFRNDFLKQVTWSPAVVESYTRDPLGRP
ncbi:MAG TPA: LamG-like jellyroll fold domain-containing protein, partial [Longimicrobium sp.]|nr:LamG-like jellyroll fold domain-containing protein [Longimicrobium sp.]